MLLNNDDWYVLIILKDAMKIFEDTTKALEGYITDGEFGLMGESIPVIKVLQDSLISL